MGTLDLIKSDLSKWPRYEQHNSFLIKFLIGFYYFIFHGGTRSIIFYRIYRPLYKKNNALFYLVRSISMIICPIEISETTSIGEGFFIPHPQCIIIGGGKLGKNVTVFQGVTIGLKKRGNEYPIIGDNVKIGSGAKVLGNVKIGPNSRIGANSVVINLKVPSYSIAVGIPAVVKQLN